MIFDRLVALSSAKLSNNSNRPEEEEEIQENKKLQEFYSYPLEYQVNMCDKKRFATIRRERERGRH